ncbi:MAG: ribosome small subunit-dependent GTPase A [Caulobacteraceae bacterium]
MLETYGWSERLQREFAPLDAQGLIAGRVIAQHRGQLILATDAGDIRAEVSGRMARDALPGELPAAGDWVAAAPPVAGGPAMVRQVLNRRTAFTRRSPEGETQVVAANVDLALLTLSVEIAPNLRRLERYLTAAWASGAAPAVALTKADLCADTAGVETAVRRGAAGAPVVLLSTVTGEGLEELRSLFSPGLTAVMVGASGAGKSTLANALLGEARMEIGAVRADDARGRHTTSHRQLLLLPGGGLLLDTPGMRELALDDAAEGLEAAFDDIEALAANCRFSDCGHGGEPGCAVRAALDAGELDEGRWRGFQKLAREIAHQAAREDPVLREQNRRRWVAIHKANRARYKFRERE